MLRIIQVSTLLGGIEFMTMPLFGNLAESAKPVVSGTVLAKKQGAGRFILIMLKKYIRKYHPAHSHSLSKTL